MEEKRIYYVGIDHGNHLMKSTNHVFENGVERLATKPTFSANTLIFEGVFYKIGEKRNSVKDSKLADDDYYLLTLAALAKECQSGSIPNGARVVLGVGLPLKHFATVRKAFVKYLKREQQPVKFRYEDVQYSFTIENVLAFPQCYAAVADKLGDCFYHFCPDCPVQAELSVSDRLHYSKISCTSSRVPSPVRSNVTPLSAWLISVVASTQSSPF